MKTQALRASIGATALASCLGLIAGCTDGSSGGGGGKGHPNVVLRDVLGNPIQEGAQTPYSPRQTCGQCHDIDQIANGYHFQQGRTDATGQIVTRDDYFGDGRTFIRSAGMYGKW